MGSSSQVSKSMNWTFEKNKKFEKALAIYSEETPDRWLKIAGLVGGTDEEEVKKQYQILLDDINSIESGKVPLPNYNTATGDEAQRRLECLKL